VRTADNLPSSCAVVTKSGNLNFLESPRPVQACNGTALLGRSRDIFVVKKSKQLVGYRVIGVRLLA